MGEKRKGITEGKEEARQAWGHGTSPRGRRECSGHGVGEKGWGKEGGGRDLREGRDGLVWRVSLGEWCFEWAR